MAETSGQRLSGLDNVALKFDTFTTIREYSERLRNAKDKSSKPAAAAEKAKGKKAPNAAKAKPANNPKGKGKDKGGKKKGDGKAVEAKQDANEKVTLRANKSENFNEWYEQILIVADILDKRYPVKGMPVYRPYGWYMHSRIMRIIEDEWEKLEIEPSQFPTAIPETFLQKEKDHVAGFESEVFWITKGGLNTLDVRLALRPTSETAMYSMFSLWVNTYRDLPLKVHQTCNVFRYETKNPTPLIRVREIPWNEAHTCHASAEEAIQLLEDAWKSYLYLINDNLGVFGLRLRRPVWDKFAGAEHTDVLDVVLPSGKVLQAVGAHYLGQKFAKPFDIQFLNPDNKLEYAFMTCFGISTRLLASMLSVHGDDRGLVLPPQIARYQVVVVPIVMKKNVDEIVNAAKDLAKKLSDAGIRVIVDDKSVKPGEKFYYWEMKGVPLRIEVGPRDLANNVATTVRRDTLEKSTISLASAADDVKKSLGDIFASMRAKAESFHQQRVRDCFTMEEVVEAVRGNGGFARIPYYSIDEDGKEGEKIIHEACGGEIRGQLAVGDGVPPEGTKCLVTGRPAKVYAYVARSY